MHEGQVIYVASHITIVICCVVVIVSVLQVMYRRPLAIVHTGTSTASLLWLAAKACVHAVLVLQFLTGKYHITAVTLLAVNSIISVVAAVCLVTLTRELLHSPTLRELKTVNDELAKTVAEKEKIITESVRAPEEL